MVDEVKLRRVVSVILADPKAWDQNTVVDVEACGTTYCIAGHTAALEGWVVRSDVPGVFWMTPPGVFSSPKGAIDRVIQFASDTLGLVDQQAEDLFFWMPESDWETGEPGVFTREDLVDRVLDVTGVDCSDLLENQKRRELALAAVNYLRDHPGEWDQRTYGHRRANGTIKVCWAGAVLLVEGYTLNVTGFHKPGAESGYSCSILGDVYRWFFGDSIFWDPNGVISISGWIPPYHGEDAMNELEKRVLAWLAYMESKTTNKES